MIPLDEPKSGHEVAIQVEIQFNAIDCDHDEFTQADTVSDESTIRVYT